MSKKYKLGELPFYSMQGEGKYTGLPCVFIRLWGCNLKCNFGGNEPTQDINSLEEFVVPERGCDSSYAWMKEYSHLAPELTLDGIVEEIYRLLPDVPDTDFGIVYTGGEPMLHQDLIVNIHDRLSEYPNNLVHIIETNGTILPIQDIENRQFHYSISPKLNSVTNQTNGIRIDTISSMINNQYNPDFVLKFVLDNNDESWNELDTVVKRLNTACYYNITDKVYIMPMGATIDQQESKKTQEIVKRALSLGYKISARMHVYIFGNQTGT